MPMEEGRSRDVHFLVLIHGMWGNPNHLAEASRIIKEVKGQRKGEEVGGVHLEVLVAQNNRDESTYDGIDWGGERVADEVEAKVQEIESDGSKVIQFSITGYSLGGLLARYVVGVLSQRNFFSTIKPVNFNTFATPHIGLLRYPSFFSTLSSSLGPKLLSRTGEQFYAVDEWSASGRPLLVVMADRNQIFYQALLLFPNIAIYANAVNDTTVPYATAGIDNMDPFANRHESGLIVEMDEKYPAIVKSYNIPEIPPIKALKPRPFTIAWVRTFKPMQILPPPLQFRFPLNLIMTALIPILIPTFIMLVFVRLSLSARSSRKRIQLLESDEESRSRKLIHMFSRLERRLEDAVVDIVDEGDATGSASSRSSSGTSTPYEGELSPPPTGIPNSFTDLSPSNRGQSQRNADSADSSGSLSDSSSSSGSRSSKTSKLKSKSKCKSNSGSRTDLPREQPIFTSSQLEMVASLNALPNICKEMAFFDHVRNSHAMIVSRDVKRFEFHKKGESVLRHWADRFEL